MRMAILTKLVLAVYVTLEAQTCYEKVSGLFSQRYIEAYPKVVYDGFFAQSPKVQS
jgi:hypothetical protein